MVIYNNHPDRRIAFTACLWWTVLKRKERTLAGCQTSQKGMSIIEIVVVLSIIGLVTGLMLPRFSDSNTQNVFKKDVALFVENVGKAQSMATASNSRSCAYTDALDVAERLDHVKLIVIDANHYRIVPFCKYPPASDPTLTPNPSYFLNQSTQNSNIVPSGCAADCIFASFYPDGTVVPGYGVSFQSGSQTPCNISISSTGLVTNSCP